jgi:hypothetical protein
MRVHSDRHPHLRPQRLDLDGLRGLLWIARFENHHRPFEPRGLGASDHCGELRGKGFSGEMTV